MKTDIAELPKHVWSSDKETQDLIIAFCRAEKVETLLEIGTCIGSTSFAVAKAKIKVITCDVEDQVHEKVKKLPNVKFVLGDRDELFKAAEGEAVGAIFIDGDHSYNALKADFKKAESHDIKLIFVHDCFGIPDVNKFCVEQIKNPHYYVMMVTTMHVDDYPNGLAIFKRK